MTMTPELIRDCLAQLALTQTAAAKMLGISKEQMYRIVHGKRDPNEAVQRLLRAYMDGYRPSEGWLGKRATDRMQKEKVGGHR